MGQGSKAMFFFQYFDFAKVAIFLGGLKTTFTLKKLYFSPSKIFDIKKLKRKNTHTHFFHPFCCFLDQNFESKFHQLC
jgi:hypothetical protein